MNLNRRPGKRPAFLFLILASLLVAACGTRVANSSWPGMAADGNVVYVAYGPGILAVDIEKKEQLWSFPAEGNSSTQFYSAPEIEGDGQLYLGDYGTSGGFFSPGVKVAIYHLSIGDDGAAPSIAWSNETLAKDRIIAPPLRADGQLFVGTADNLLLALDAATGSLNWDIEVGHSIWGQPTFDDGIIYVTSLDKEVYALKMENGEQVWRATLGGPVVGQARIGEELIYVGSFDKALHALDKETGQERWQVAAEGAVWGAPALANGRVYFADELGNVYAVDAISGTKVWDKALTDLVVAAPIVADDKIFVALAGNPDLERGERDGAIVALETATGDEVWRETTPVPLYSTPVIAGDAIVVAVQSQEALLIVFAQEDGTRRWDFVPSSQSES